MADDTTVPTEHFRFPLTASNAFDWLVNVISGLWRYRFFFSGLDFFMQRAPVLLDRYTEFQNWIIQRLAALHEDRIKDGSMKAPIEPNITLQIAANVWMLWVAWIRWEMINTRTTALPEERRSEEHTSELQSLMRISYAVFGLKKKTN